MPALPQARAGSIFFVVEHGAGLKKDSSGMTGYVACRTNPAKAGSTLG
jgi:hypothetical protein